MFNVQPNTLIRIEYIEQSFDMLHIQKLGCILYGYKKEILFENSHANSAVPTSEMAGRMKHYILQFTNFYVQKCILLANNVDRKCNEQPGDGGRRERERERVPEREREHNQNEYVC